MFMREHIRWIGGFDRRSSLHGYMGHTTILYVYTWIDWFFLIHTFSLSCHLSSYYLPSEVAMK